MITLLHSIFNLLSFLAVISTLISSVVYRQTIADIQLTIFNENACKIVINRKNHVIIAALP